MSKELTQADIDGIRDTLSKATPAPWRYDGQHYEITAPAAKGDDPYWLISSECRSAPDQQHKCDEFGHEYDNNFALIEKLRNNAEALLKAAEYGKRAKEFFREMENKLADQRVTVICNDYCPIDLAKALGLLPKERE